MKYKVLPISAFCLLPLLLVCVGEAKKSDKVRLEKIQTLTLQADRWTTGRRSSPIKQLTCVGGYCSKARVTAAQCYNRGFDGRDVQWECKAEMPADFKFGKIEVICEGYDYPEDEYVLVGSCGLEYTIDEVGGGHGASHGYNSHSNQQYFAAKSHIEKSDFSYMPIIFIVGLIALIYFTCLRDTTTQGASSSSSSTNDDHYPRPSAPPPPGFRSEYYDSGPSCSAGAAGSSGTRSRSSGPGFMSGIAAGGLLGYLFGSSRSNTYANRPTYSSSSWGYSAPSTSSGYSGASSSSSETRTSSGFGGTRRR